MATSTDPILKGKPFAQGLDIRGFSSADEKDLVELRKMVHVAMAELAPDARLALIDTHVRRVAARQSALKEHVDLCVALKERAHGYSSTEAYPRALSILRREEWPATDYLDERLLLDAIVEMHRTLQRGT